MPLGILLKSRAAFGGIGFLPEALSAARPLAVRDIPAKRCCAFDLAGTYFFFPDFFRDGPIKRIPPLGRRRGTTEAANPEDTTIVPEIVSLRFIALVERHHRKRRARLVSGATLRILRRRRTLLALPCRGVTHALGPSAFSFFRHDRFLSVGYRYFAPEPPKEPRKRQLVLFRVGFGFVAGFALVVALPFLASRAALALRARSR